MTPEAQEIISKIKKKEIRKMQKCIDGPEEMKVLVSESREVLRVVDPDNQLQSNECFFAPKLDGSCPMKKNVLNRQNRFL